MSFLERDYSESHSKQSMPKDQCQVQCSS
jgi:hypothetical protein